MPASQIVPSVRGLEPHMSAAAAVTVPSVAVYVRTERHDAIDPPMVVGGWAVIRPGRVLQGRLRELTEATSHAHGVVVVLIDVLGRLRRSESEARVVVPDGCVADLLLGPATPKTRKMADLVGRPRTLLKEKLPHGRVTVGRFYDVVSAGTYEDAWS